MENYTQQFGIWQPYFTTLTVVCATLAGLLFVALSLHAGALRKEENSNLRRLAQHTFSGFVQILFIGLFFIVPDAPPAFFAIAILIVVVIGFRHVLERFVQTFRDHGSALHRGYFFKRLWLSLLADILLLNGAVGLLLHTAPHSIYNDMLFIFSGATALMVGAMNNSWYLLAHELGSNEMGR